MFLYHAIVRLILGKAFAKLRRTRSGAHIAAQFAKTGTFWFTGDSELGGERTGRAAVAEWFEKVFAFFPDLSLTPVTIVIAGGPWDTRITTRLRITATLPDGTPYENEGLQYLRMRFGSIVEDRIYEDTARLDRALTTIAAAR